MASSRHQKAYAYPSPVIIMMDLYPMSKWRTSTWIKDDDGTTARVETTDFYLESSWWISISIKTATSTWTGVKVTDLSWRKIDKCEYKTRQNSCLRILEFMPRKPRLKRPRIPSLEFKKNFYRESGSTGGSQSVSTVLSVTDSPQLLRGKFI